MITLAQSCMCNFIWSTLEWRRPQRGNRFALFPKDWYCFIPTGFLMTANIVEIVLCSGWFQNLGNFQREFAHHQCLLQPPEGGGGGGG